MGFCVSEIYDKWKNELETYQNFQNNYKSMDGINIVVEVKIALTKEFLSDLNKLGC